MERCIRILKGVLFIAILCFAILFFLQSEVSARTLKTINTLEELNEAFGNKATIDGNVIKLTDDVTLTENSLSIEIAEIIIDFNGKTIECKDDGAIYVCNKVTLKDSSTTNRENWGGFIFNIRLFSCIEVKEGAELVIDSGKFVEGSDNTYSMIEVLGNLTINDATFSSNKTEADEDYLNTMIKLRENSVTIINNGNFSHVATIIRVESNIAYYNNAKLTINGGNFKSTDEGYGTIYISANYPYVDENNNKKIITPTIVLNNCNVEGKYSALSFWGGTADEDFRNADTGILTIIGGTYTATSENGVAALQISALGKYFNPKDIVLQNGTFECYSSWSGAIRLDGPGKR